MISKINIQNFRILEDVSIKPDACFNCFYGVNGSGKTSLLEALYWLAVGRSFRSRQFQYVLKHDAEEAVVFSEGVDEKGHTWSLGATRKKTGDPKLKALGQSVSSFADMAKVLPLQLMNHKSLAFLEEGPQARRKFLDWAVFHVEHSFQAHWAQAKRLLKQRNSLLKQGKLQYSDLLPWDEVLVSHAKVVEAQRGRVLNAFLPVFYDVLAFFLPKFTFELQYARGWGETEALSEALKRSFARDLAIGHTTAGPHRADLSLTVDGRPILDVLSRGQQKLLSLALYLAEGAFLKAEKQKETVYLMDDLASELDAEKRGLVLEYLSTSKAQVFLTAIHPEDLDCSVVASCQMFHVEHGRVTPGVTGFVEA